MTCDARWAVCLALALAGCTDQDPGLEGTVEVTLAALSGEAIATADGPARLTDARLSVDRVLLELCEDEVAGPLDWLIGRARAHGDVEHADGSVTVPLAAKLIPGAVARGVAPVPPDHAICGLVLVLAQPFSAELSASLDGMPHHWPLILTPLRWPVDPVRLDSTRRAATWTIAVDPDRWLTGLNGDEGTVQGRLADAVRTSITVEAPTP